MVAPLTAISFAASSNISSPAESAAASIAPFAEVIAMSAPLPSPTPMVKIGLPDPDDKSRTCVSAPAPVALTLTASMFPGARTVRSSPTLTSVRLAVVPATMSMSSPALPPSIDAPSPALTPNMRAAELSVSAASPAAMTNRLPSVARPLPST